MRSTDDVIFAVLGQTLRHRVRAARPTSATFSVFADSVGDDGTAEFSGTATVDSVSTTLSAGAGAATTDPTVVPLTSAVGVTVGRRYLLTEDGRREWVQVVALNGSTVYSAYPLANVYTTAATFVSTEISAAVDATWVIDAGRLSNAANPDPDYRIRWTIVTSGVTTIAYTFFDLVRGAVDHGITMDDLESRLWNVIDGLPIDHRVDQGRRVIESAWEDVKSDLAGNRINDAAIRDTSIVDQLLMRRIRLTFAENGHVPQGMTAREAIGYASDEYQRFFERNFAFSSNVPLATGPSSASTPTTFRGWSK